MRHVDPTALLVRVQCLMKCLHMAVEGRSTRHIIFSIMSNTAVRYCTFLSFCRGNIHDIS